MINEQSTLLLVLNLLLNKGKTCILHSGLVFLDIGGQGLYFGFESPLLRTKPLNHSLLMLELEVLGLQFCGHVSNPLVPVLDSLLLTLELYVLTLELCLHLLDYLILLREELVLLTELYLEFVIAKHDVGPISVHVPKKNL